MAIIRSNNRSLINVTALPFATGGLVKLQTTDITSSTATLVFNSTLITDTYDKYIVEYTGLKPVTDNVNLRSRVSSDNGSSFVTGTYHYGYHFTQLGGADGANSGSGKSNYARGDFALGNDAVIHIMGLCILKQ